MLDSMAIVKLCNLRSSLGAAIVTASCSFQCLDAEGGATPALRSDIMDATVELEKKQVTLRCPELEVNTTESFLMQCKNLGLEFWL